LFPPLAKPSPPKQLAVSMSASEELRVAWSPPGGGTPPQCLEYEVQLTGEPGDAKAAWTVGTTHTVPLAGEGWGNPFLMAGSREEREETVVLTELWVAC